MLSAPYLANRVSRLAAIVQVPDFHGQMRAQVFFSFTARHAHTLTHTHTS